MEALPGAKDIRLSEGHECWRGVFIKLFNVKPFRTESRVKDMSYLVFSCSVVIGVSSLVKVPALHLEP